MFSSHLARNLCFLSIIPQPRNSTLIHENDGTSTAARYATWRKEIEDPMHNSLVARIKLASRDWPIPGVVIQGASTWEGDVLR